MRKLITNEIKTRIDDELKRKINSYLITNPQLSVSELIRDALTDYLTKDIRDRELTALNVQRLVKKSENLKDTLLLFMELFCYFTKSWLVYKQDIPTELKQSAWQAGQIRFEKFMEGFRTKLTNDTNIIEKLIMTFLENSKEPADE